MPRLFSNTTDSKLSAEQQMNNFHLNELNRIRNAIQKGAMLSHEDKEFLYNNSKTWQSMKLGPLYAISGDHYKGTDREKIFLTAEKETRQRVEAGDYVKGNLDLDPINKLIDCAIIRIKQ